MRGRFQFEISTAGFPLPPASPFYRRKSKPHTKSLHQNFSIPKVSQPFLSKCPPIVFRGITKSTTTKHHFNNNKIRQNYNDNALLIPKQRQSRPFFLDFVAADMTVLIACAKMLMRLTLQTYPPLKEIFSPSNTEIVSQ